MKRIPCVGCLALAAALAPSAMPQADAQSPKYKHEQTVYLGVAGITGEAFDAAANRLWVGNRAGLHSIDFAQAKLQLTGPLVKVRVTGDLEFAADMNRLFFEKDDDQIAYLDVRTSTQPVSIGRVPKATALVYEPRRRELYVVGDTPRVEVLNAVSGERVATIELPGSFGRAAVAMSGRVYLTVGRKTGLFVIDRLTRRVESQPVSGQSGSPHAIEADQTNGRLFVAYGREVVAVDIASGAVLGRAASTMAAIAYDAGAGLLVVTNHASAKGLTSHIDTYRLEASGLVRVDRTSWVAPGTGWLEPTHYGFVQLGTSTSASDEPMQGHSPSLLIWRAKAQ